MCIGEFTQTGATLQYYSIQIFDGTRSSQPDQQNLVSRKHGKASGSQNLVFGKIKDAKVLHSQWVPEKRKQSATPGAMSQQLQEAGQGSRFLDKYLKLMLVEMVRRYPGLRKRQLD